MAPPENAVGLSKTVRRLSTEGMKEDRAGKIGKMDLIRTWRGNSIGSRVLVSCFSLSVYQEAESIHRSTAAATSLVG
jgi:hypothetical protein